MAWSTSSRLQELPSNWKQLRKRVLVRDNYTCRWRGCSDRANQVDHITPGGSDDESNLQSLCEYHHRRKSTAEGHAANAAIRKKLKHPGEPHPGKIHPRDARPPKHRGF